MGDLKNRISVESWIPFLIKNHQRNNNTIERRSGLVIIKASFSLSFDTWENCFWLWKYTAYRAYYMQHTTVSRNHKVEPNMVEPSVQSCGLWLRQKLKQKSEKNHKPSMVECCGCGTPLAAYIHSFSHGIEYKFVVVITFIFLRDRIYICCGYYIQICLFLNVPCCAFHCSNTQGYIDDGDEMCWW